jgi:hypothetical protein
MTGGCEASICRIVSMRKKIGAADQFGSAF